MTIGAINSVSNNYSNLSFGENLINAQITNNKPKMSITTKVILGTSLAALAAIGVYIATRGKIKTQGSNNKPAEQLKEMSLKLFKDSGNKFEKGKAMTAAGEGYTGTLTHTTPNGNFTIKYENGFLMESKCDKFHKIYEYDNDGNLIKISDGENAILSRIINGDTIYTKRYRYDNHGAKSTISKNGKLKYMVGKDNTITFYNSDSSIPSGSKLIVRKAGEKRVGEYMLETPEGEKVIYNACPQTNEFGLTRLKEIKIVDPRNNKCISIIKEKYDSNGSKIEYYVNILEGQNSKSTYYDENLKLINGNHDDSIIPIIENIKNIHKDVCRIFDDFGGIDKFFFRYIG